MRLGNTFVTGVELGKAWITEFARCKSSEEKLRTSQQAADFKRQISQDWKESKEDDCYKEISLEEVEKAILKTNTGKAAGVDGIYNEMLKNGGYWMKISLWYLFNAVLTQKRIPKEWKYGLILPLYKDGDREVAVNYRGITLLSNVGKVFVAVIGKRLTKWCEQKGIFEQEQAGFRPGRTTINHIFTLAETIKRRKRD